MRTIAITIDDETLERLSRIGRRGPAGRNRSQLIRDAVRDYVARLERCAEEEREAAVVRRHRRQLTRQAAAAVRVQAKP